MHHLTKEDWSAVAEAVGGGLLLSAFGYVLVVLMFCM